MKKVVRLSESELTNLIKTVVKETKRNKRNGVNEDLQNFFNPEAMSTGGAIATMVGTTIALLGIAGWDYLKELYSQLRDTKGKEKEAMELESIISDYEENKMTMDSDNEMDMDSEMDMGDEEMRNPMAESIRRHIRRR
jgi:predicted component of type VI protein secretion system